MLDDVNAALEVLGQKGVILYPTDTVWGIGCDSTDQDAVDKIYSIKRNKDKKSMIILIDKESKLYDYVDQVPEAALNLIRITDNPLTIIFPGARNIAPNLIPEDGSVGIRIVRDPFCKMLIEKFDKPVVSTSANLGGRPWPGNYSNIDPIIINAVDYIVTWRQNETARQRPSGIIKVGLNGEIKVIRE